MGAEILREVPGLLIAFDPEAHTLVPYCPADRPDGDRNHGWVDLRGRPDLVAAIPEARKSAGLRRLLRALAEPQSAIFSIGCECAAFHRPGEPEPPWHVGGFVDVSLSDPARASDRAELVSLAEEIADNLRFETEHFCTFEFIVAPLKTYFGRPDCFELQLKPHGYGDDEATAWAAFDVAATAIADAITRPARPKLSGLPS